MINDAAIEKMCLHSENHIHARFMKQKSWRKTAADFQQSTQNRIKFNSKNATEWTVLLGLKSAGSLAAQLLYHETHSPSSHSLVHVLP